MASSPRVAYQDSSLHNPEHFLATLGFLFASESI